MMSQIGSHSPQVNSVSARCATWFSLPTLITPATGTAGGDAAAA
jgi:hypothetical protein